MTNDSRKQGGKSGRRFGQRKGMKQRPLLSVPQVVVLLGVIFALFVALDLNRRAQNSRQVNLTEESLKIEVELELTRAVELQATVDYVHSEDYVAAFAREEAGQLLPGERRIVPLMSDVTAVPTVPPQPTPDPAYVARPWQAWWRLLSDAPLPAP